MTSNLWSRLICIGIISLVFSCEKEGIEVRSNPRVRILSSPQIANGITTIEVSVEDTAYANQLEYYVDSNLLKQETPIQAKKISFDTRLFGDGVHMFKVTLTDKAGRQAFDEKTLTIRNKVLTINTSANYLSSSEDSVFIFVSDKNGTTVAKGSATNGMQISLIALHHFDADPLMFTVYRYDPAIGYRVMNSFYPVAYGASLQLDRQSTNGNTQYTYLDVQNIPEEFERLHLSSMKMEYANLDEVSIAFFNPFSLVVNGTQPDSVLVILDGKNSARFNMIRNLMPDNLYLCDLSSTNFVRSDDHFTISFPETIPTWGFATLYGHPYESSLDEKMVLGVGRATQFETKSDLYYYPKAEQQFKSFSLNMSGDFLEEMMVHGVKSLDEIPKVYTSVKADALYSYTLNADSIAVELRPRRGKIASHLSRFHDYQGNTYWTMYQSGSALTIVPPDLPEELSKQPHNIKLASFEYQTTDYYSYEHSSFETLVSQALKEDYEYEYSPYEDPVFHLANSVMYKNFSYRIFNEGRSQSRQEAAINAMRRSRGYQEVKTK